MIPRVLVTQNLPQGRESPKVLTLYWETLGETSLLGHK